MNEKAVENTVQLFNSEEFGTIRSIMIDMAPWFVGRDVATALGYAKPENAIAAHVFEEDKTSTLIQGSGSNYKSKAIIINESGLYALVFGSKLESAKRFKHWVTSEILPAIRKTGSYSVKTTGQQRFDLMNQEVLAVQKLQNEMMSKLDALEVARKQDRQALDNVLFVCKQLDRKLQGAPQGQSAKQVEPAQQEKAEQPKQSYTSYQPKGMSEWRTELYKTVKVIKSLSGLTMPCILKQGYDYLERNYGWYSKDALKDYIKLTGFKGNPKHISGVDLIEASEMYKSIFMSIMKDRLENERHNIEVKKGIKTALTKKPPVLPADVLPVRRQAEEHEIEPAPEVADEFPKVLSPENPGGALVTIVAEAHAVEVETPAERAERIAKKKYNYYKPSMTFPIIKPIAEKLGDKTKGCSPTYQKVYNIIGIAKMNRMKQAYIRLYNKPPKSTPDIFQTSEKNMKVFKDAVKALDSIT